MPLSPRERVSYALRVVISHALYYSGLLHLLQRFVLRRKAVVLMYHRVLTPEQRQRTASQPGLVVEAATFARQMALLKQRFTVLTLEQFAHHLSNRLPFGDSCCLITFDDGWIDNYRNAFPVLQDHSLPAVIFLPVNFIGERRLFTREALTHLLVCAVHAVRRDPGRAEALRARLAPLGLEGVLDVSDARPLGAILTIIEKHRYASGPAFESMVSDLSAELGVAVSDLPELDTFIDWAQVGEMARHGITFGGHGAEHRVLTQVAPDAVVSEVESSRDVLSSRLDTPVYAFAYPGGGWDADVAATVERSGYTLAFTIEPGCVSSGDDRFSIRRVNIHEGMTGSIPMFMARLTGIF